ncbi:hypothetical protein AB205_0163100 [Aquarana catesbeiana]|uniref:Uncharacterized protein n=1 Tax=Aquarana catesbeiana TaxID=8400 RepID=A0A2G9S0J9_AQUCT|nr:hypothetical protein AB205_0163100 [Aquarana catesbeiana]
MFLDQPAPFPSSLFMFGLLFLIFFFLPALMHMRCNWSQAVSIIQANSDISLLHVKFIIFLLENLHRTPKHYICFFLVKTLENTMAVTATFYLARYFRSDFSNTFFLGKKTVSCFMKKTKH